MFTFLRCRENARAYAPVVSIAVRQKTHNRGDVLMYGAFTLVLSAPLPSSRLTTTTSPAMPVSTRGSEKSRRSEAVSSKRRGGRHQAGDRGREAG